ncbi:MAG: alpha/beta hydrolase [Rhizobiaceae bacterium]|nr:alpha/beta hydrolase [Rhizobiaceae bacterium]
MACELKQLTLADGNTMEYAHRPGGDQPIVLIHGYADSWYSFKGVMDFLPGNLAAFAPTLLGHGRSSKPARAYTIEGYAAEVLEFMRSLGIERSAIVGHSMGTFVAQSIALSHPANVSSMVLIGSAVTADNPVLRSLYGETLDFEDPVSSDFVRNFQSGTCVGPFDPCMSLDDIVGESSLLPAHVWSSALKGLMDYRSADFDDAALSALRTPTLVLGGVMDEIFNEAAQRKLADALPHSEIRLEADVGHSPNWEKPRRIARQIAEFVAKQG